MLLATLVEAENDDTVGRAVSLYCKREAEGEPVRRCDVGEVRVVDPKVVVSR